MRHTNKQNQIPDREKLLDLLHVSHRGPTHAREITGFQRSKKGLFDHDLLDYNRRQKNIMSISEAVVVRLGLSAYRRIGNMGKKS